MSTRYRANDNKSLRALFSVICLCIVALGLIVYFSTQTRTTDVNEATTIAETQTTEVQNRVTVKETVTQTEPETKQATTKKAKKPTTTEAPTMANMDTNVPYKSFYKYPCDEAVLNPYTQELVFNSTMGDYRAHWAIDFKCSKGSKIESINDGLVMSVEKDNLLGRVVTIDHGSKLIVKYCGLDTVNVSKGDYVTIGQQLGTLGEVPFEAKDESHLHLEATLEGKSVNPLDVMGKTE